MSIKLMTSVWGRQMDPMDKLVMLALADNANEDGTCWPSITNIALKSCLSIRTVQRSIRRLEELGAVTPKERSGRSHLYRLTPDRLSPLTESHPCQPDTPPLTHSHGGDDTQSGEGCHTVTQNHHRTIIESSMNRQEVRAVRSLATRLPMNFELIESRKAVAVREGIDPQRTFESFTDYWRSAAGANARKHDWDAAWRNWCRREADSPRKSNGHQAPKRIAKTVAQLEAEEAANAQH